MSLFMHDLEDIEEIINSFKDEKRSEIIQYYSGLFQDHVNTKNVITNKEIQVFISICKLEKKLDSALMEGVLNKKIDQVQTYILNNNKVDVKEKKLHFSKVSKWMKAVVKDIRNTFGYDKTEAANSNFDEPKVPEQIKDQKENRNADQSSDSLNEACLENSKLSDFNKDGSKTRIELCTNTEEDVNSGLFQSFNKKFCSSIISIFFSSEKFNSSANQLLIDLYYYKDRFSKIKDSNIDKLIDKVSGNFENAKALNEAEILEIIKSE